MKARLLDQVKSLVKQQWLQGLPRDIIATMIDEEMELSQILLVIGGRDFVH